jgi:hypothetical protein
MHRLKEVRPLRWVLLLAMAMAMPAAAHAQSFYVDYSATRLTDLSGNVHSLYGPTGGATFNLLSLPKLTIGMDFRGGFQEESGVTGSSFTSFQIGPKLSTSIKRVKPFGEFLIGFARYNDGLNNPTSKSTDSDLALDGGVDIRITRHFDWRLIDYTWSKYLGLGEELDPRTYSTGLVVHF